MRIALVGSLVVAALFGASPLGAQMDDDDPETRVVTVSSFHMPFYLMDDYMEYIEKYTLPVDKENPHMLSYRYLLHSWGGNEPNVWLITEYENMGEIEAAEDWNEERFEKMFPDSAQRESIGKEFEDKFGQYFAHHTDNILSGPVTHLK